MIAVIIAGGSGTRLWPLSTPEYPKHLLALTGSHSLLQYTYERAKAIGDHVYVVTEKSHAKYVQAQLPELAPENFIIEPGRRGTASCILAALTYLSLRHKADEAISFLAADHYIRDMAGFVHSFKVAEAASTKSDRLVLIGVEPYLPATGFGYIEKDGLYDEKSFVFNVKCFKEKPTFEKAKRYVASGNYLWNCSYFVGSLNTFLKVMKSYAPQLFTAYGHLIAAKTTEEYKKIYLALKNESIDYALMEKAKQLLVVPARFDWLDLGSFADLHKALDQDEQGNHIYGKHIELSSVENSFIQNYEDKPVAVIGLDNIAVVNTPHGVLVTRKDLAQHVGEISKRFNKSAD